MSNLNKLKNRLVSGKIVASKNILNNLHPSELARLIESMPFGIAEFTCLLLPPLPLLTFLAIINPSVSNSFNNVEILLGVNPSILIFIQASE